MKKTTTYHLRFFLVILALGTCGFVAAQPLNDNCANAITLSVNASCTNGVTNAGTIETGELTSCLGSNIDQTVWYQFVATAPDMDVVIIGNSANKCYFGSAIWDPTTSPCPVTTGTAISCENLTGGPLSQKHELAGLVVSNTYLVQIGYNSDVTCGSSVSFCIGVYDSEVSSDDCANAVNVTTYTSYTVSNAEATADMDLCSGSTENNIWFKWVAPSWWTPGALAYVHLYNQNCDNSAGLQLSIFEKANCGQIPNPAAAGSPPGSYGDCIFWANTQTTNNIQYSWAADPGDVFYFDIDGDAGAACLFTFMVSPYSCFTATATTTTAAPCPPATGGTATVTPTGVNSPFTYSWGTAPVQTTQTATGLTANTTYNVTVTDAVACQVVTSATVPGPAAAGFNTTGSFCTSGTGGTGVIFTNTGTTAASGATFSWTFPSGTPATSTAENQTVTWAAAGTYAVSQDVTKDGCTQNSTQNVTIVDCSCPLAVNAGSDIILCDNTTTTLNGSYSNATSAPVYLINDNFDSYANQAAFEASPWEFPYQGSTTPALSTTQASSPTQSIYFTNDGMYQEFTAQTVLTVEFKVYVTNGDQESVALTYDTYSNANIGPDVAWQSSNLYYTYGGFIYPVSVMSQNAWHTIRLDVSTGTDTYDIYLDGSLVKSSAPFLSAQTQINRIYIRKLSNSVPTFFLDDVQVYYQVPTIAWTVTPACAGCLSSTTLLNPTFTPPIVASPTIYTYTLCIQDDCSGACPNSKVDAVTVTVNHCCNLTADAASNDDDNDTTFNMCTQPTLVMAGAYTNAYYNPVNTYYINDNMEYATDAAWQASWTVTEENASTTADPSTAQSVSPTTSIKFTDASGGGPGKSVTADKTFTAISVGTAECYAMNDGVGQFNVMSLYQGATFKAQIIFASDLTLQYFNDAWNSLGSYTVNTFYNIKMEFDAVANTCEIFIDGVSKFTGTLPNAGTTTINTYRISTVATATNVGYVDDVKVYTTAPGVGPATVLWTAGTLNPGYPATGLSSTTILAPTFTPTAAGNYQFTLTVTDACGTATSDMLVTITSNNCIATFSVNDASQDLGSYPVAPYNTFNFLNTGSTGSPWTFSWDMGGAGTYLNSSTSYSENPDFTYNAAGTYTVTHTVSMPLTGACPATSCFTTIPVTVTLPPCSDTYRVYYQSRATGDWNVLATWDFSCDAGVTDPWTPAVSFLPTYVKKTIRILSGHIVTITANVTVDEVIIDAGGTLIYSGGTLTINNGPGIDLIINGTFQDSGPNSIGR